MSPETREDGIRVFDYTIEYTTYYCTGIKATVVHNNPQCALRSTRNNRVEKYTVEKASLDAWIEEGSQRLCKRCFPEG